MQYPGCYDIRDITGRQLHQHPHRHPSSTETLPQRHQIPTTSLHSLLRKWFLQHITPSKLTSPALLPQNPPPLNIISQVEPPSVAVYSKQFMVNIPLLPVQLQQLGTSTVTMQPMNPQVPHAVTMQPVNSQVSHTLQPFYVKNVVDQTLTVLSVSHNPALSAPQNCTEIIGLQLLCAHLAKAPPGANLS